MAKKRADFALPGGRFPLNTPGRVKAAPGLARYSESKGNISAGQADMVMAKAAKKRKGLLG
jgi:hypothetical protein